MEDRARSLRVLRLTALGGLVLVAITAGRAAGIPALVLMLGPGVAVPLGLSIGLDARYTPEQTFPVAVLTRLAPFGAAAGVLGWLAPPGHPFAIAGAIVHALVCVTAGLLGLTRLWSRRTKSGPVFGFGPLHEIAIDVGLLFLPVASA